MANMKRGTKRTIDEECRAFNESWAIKYFFVVFKSKPMCVICNEIVSIKKEYNIKRHYDTKHAKTYGDYTGDRRAEKLAALRRYAFKY